jgi:hypothetical protein
MSVTLEARQLSTRAVRIRPPRLSVFAPGMIKATSFAKAVKLLLGSLLVVTRTCIDVESPPGRFGGILEYSIRTRKNIFGCPRHHLCAHHRAGKVWHEQSPTLIRWIGTMLASGVAGKKGCNLWICNTKVTILVIYVRSLDCCVVVLQVYLMLECLRIPS